MKKIIFAIQFLTIIPISKTMTFNEDGLAKSSSFFVIVGFFQGMLLIASDYILGRVFHPDLVTGLILLVLVLSNGGLHLDGLSDTFDAVASKSEGNREKDRQRRLSIMKDSNAGSFGVMAIVFALALKYLSLKSLSNLLPFTYYTSLLLMPVFSKWAMVISMFHGKPSRKDGLGKVFIEGTGLKEVAISSITLLLIMVLILASPDRYMPHNQILSYISLLALIYLFCRIIILFFDRMFGGLNGDTLGAISEITEIIFLLMVLAWSQLFT